MSAISTPNIVNVCKQGTTAVQQGFLFVDESLSECQDYLSKQLITYIGNKRLLLGEINMAIEKVKNRLGKNKLHMLDAFAGSGVVSRLFKAHASRLVSNDLEGYAAVLARCFLRNRSEVNMTEIADRVKEFNHRVISDSLPQGFIEELYAPRNERQITKNDRVFYTCDNARRLDRYRMLIDSTTEREMLLGPLLAKASVHVNTSGVFKGFYKDRFTGVGSYGGTKGDALKRIRGKIELEVPLLSRFECDVQVFQNDANDLVKKLKGFDLAYFDPPYNQHPYGSNYFMLNLIVDYKRPNEISRVSGIPVDWTRSGYNVQSQSLSLFADLVRNVDARFLLISFNNEGFITPQEMHSLLSRIGRVETTEITYNTFRGSRNLRNRNIHVTEQLFLVERY